MGALSPCVEPGCPNLTDAGKCAIHRREARRRSDRRRPTADQRGYDRRWRQTRRAYLRGHPGCEVIDCDAPATMVDHIDGLGPLGPYGHDEFNLRSMCDTCHGRRTARDQPGGWNQR